MVCYSHLSENVPQFLVMHIVKGFGIVNKAEIDVFLELSCFFDDPVDVGNLISVSSGNTLQYSCLENPMDGEAWWATVHGLQTVGHD